MSCRILVLLLVLVILSVWFCQFSWLFVAFGFSVVLAGSMFVVPTEGMAVRALWFCLRWWLFVVQVSVEVIGCSPFWFCLIFWLRFGPLVLLLALAVRAPWFYRSVGLF